MDRVRVDYSVGSRQRREGREEREGRKERAGGCKYLELIKLVES